MGEWLAGEQQTFTISIELDCVTWFVDSVIGLNGIGIIMFILDDSSLVLFQKIFNVHHSSGRVRFGGLTWLDPLE